MDNIILSRRWVQGTPVTIDNLTGTAFTGEAQAHTFRISGVDAAGADVQITGTVTGAFLAPNNVTIPLEGTLTDGVAEVTLTSQCYELPGRFILSVYAANGDTNLCIYCGVGYVFCTETDQVAYPSAAIPDISQLIQEAQDVIDSIPEDYTALSAHFPATGKFVVGTNTSATEENAVAEGEDTIASGLSSHAEGYASEASGDYSHSEGGSIASGGCSHAEGSASEASGENAHAEGYETTASGDNSHSEGWGATASGMNAHAEGVDTVASGNMSHSEGEGTIANHAAQSVSGTYNVADTSQAAATAKGTYAEIVGNGTADNARSNARTLDWSGNEALSGDLTINKNGQNEMTVGEELGNLKSAMSAIDTATAEDVGKALKAKTVSGGKVTEWEFGDVGSPTDDELSTASENPVQNKVITNALGSYSSLSDYGSNITEILAWLIDAVENPIDPNAVDICVFAGQSNMDGRGDSSEAPTVQTGTAFKWDSSNQEVIDFTAEPSMIPAYVKTYYEKARVPIVEIKEATGGINITQWMSTWGSATATNITGCKNYLESHGKTVRRIFMLWNQGENDVYDGTTEADYESYFAQMKSTVMTAGVEKIFVINIGQVSQGNYDFTNIRNALEDVCDGTDVIMVSDKFYNAKQYMKDQWHYNQIVYNVVGQNAADNTVYFYKTGNDPVCIPFDASDVYGVPDDYMDLSTSGWSYVLVGIKAILTACSAVTTEVKLYGKLNDMYYRVCISYPVSTPGALEGNTVTKNVSIADGVVFAAPTTGNEGGYGTNFAKNATALESITGIPSMNLSSEAAFYGASALAQGIDITNMNGTWTNIFRNCGVTAITGDGTRINILQNVFRNCQNLVSVCDLDGTYTRADGCFRDDAKLESVGVIKGTSLTNIDSMFYGCSKLEGTVKFMSSGITTAQYAFYNCDLTKIEIQVPENSTTYTTITTAYPDANVTTFTPEE